MAVHNERVILHGIEGKRNLSTEIKCKTAVFRGHRSIGQFLPIATWAEGARVECIVETCQRRHFKEADSSRLE